MLPFSRWMVGAKLTGSFCESGHGIRIVPGKDEVLALDMSDLYWMQALCVLDGRRTEAQLKDSAASKWRQVAA